jgi:hypothetical protein
MVIVDPSLLGSRCRFSRDVVTALLGLDRDDKQRETQFEGRILAFCSPRELPPTALSSSKPELFVYVSIVKGKHEGRVVLLPFDNVSLGRRGKGRSGGVQ